MVVRWVPEHWDPTPWIQANTWVFAKTAVHNPHAYVFLGKSVDWRTQIKFGWWIRKWGYEERWGRDRYMYKDFGEHHYWMMPSPNDTIINRKRLDGGDPTK